MFTIGLIIITFAEDVCNRYEISVIRWFENILRRGFTYQSESPGQTQVLAQQAFQVKVIGDIRVSGIIYDV